MSDATMTNDQDCDEGCDGDHKHAWEISPHPQSSDFDWLVCDDDTEAGRWLEVIVEQVWDEIEPGEERTITIRRNKVASDE